MPVDRDVQTRFAELVIKGGPDDCWNCIGHEADGIPRLHFGKGKRYFYSHHVAYAIANNLDLPLDDFLGKKRTIIFTCNNKKCCNPKHLVVVRR